MRCAKCAFAFALLFHLAGCAAKQGAARLALNEATASATSAHAGGTVPVKDAAAPAAFDEMVLIKGGTFLMGADNEMPDESPAHEVVVQPFWIDRHEVTVAEFARFVEATGYRTEAERFGWSGVFDTASGEWMRRDGANWRHPEGSARSASTLHVPALDEPVTQISYADASAYARWAGKRLPTEAEWELAARGGLQVKRYSWGDELRPHGKPAANWWQGEFPARDTGEDGFAGRAPVAQFAPNNYGLYDMGGNVWEWCADWYDARYYTNGESVADNPRGPAAGAERVIRGGSWMCSENYCSNYRVAARGHTAPDSGLNNLGFRCARALSE